RSYRPSVTPPPSSSVGSNMVEVANLTISHSRPGSGAPVEVSHMVELANLTISHSTNSSDRLQGVHKRIGRILIRQDAPRRISGTSTSRTPAAGGDSTALTNAAIIAGRVTSPSRSALARVEDNHRSKA